MKSFLIKLGIYYTLLVFLLLNVTGLFTNRIYATFLGLLVITLPMLVLFGKYQKFRPIFEAFYANQSTGKLLDMQEIQKKFNNLSGDYWGISLVSLGITMVITLGFTTNIGFWLCLVLGIVVIICSLVSSVWYNIGYNIGNLFIRTETLKSTLPSNLIEEMSTFKYKPFKDSRGGSLGGENFFMPEFLLKDGTCSFRDYEELVQLHSKIYIEKALSEFEKLKNKKIEKKARKAKKKELLTG